MFHIGCTGKSDVDRKVALIGKVPNIPFSAGAAPPLLPPIINACTDAAAADEITACQTGHVCHNNTCCVHTVPRQVSLAIGGVYL